ncbi:amidinotransferase, partial [Pseudomonas fluorescens]
MFPNNWISTHENGDVALYPMFAENRRLERRPEVLNRLEESGFTIENVVDYTAAEEEDLFLEGTGSLLLDRVNRKAYCSISPRADEDLLIEFCEDFEYTPVIFTAYQSVDGKRLPIYHTNVMMALGENYCVICLDCID